MARPVTIFTGQWADLPLQDLATKIKSFGYDGLELACWGDHFDVFKAAESAAYCKSKKAMLKKAGLNCWAISNHLAGQLVCDPNDDCRSDNFGMLPKNCNGNAEKKRAWAVEAMKASARAAKNMGIGVVNGFTGSPIWHMLYSFPPVSDKMIDDGYKFFAKMWNPILDEFDACGVKFALEVHPTEIAFDLYSAKRALAAIKNRPAFGFNFDPSHLLWQGVDPVAFLREFPDRIYHVHVKDASVTLDGRSGILSSHLNFGQPNRGWDFRSPGHGDVNFEEIIRELNRIGYNGPLSVEWEDCGMDRDYGAKDACAFVRSTDFAPSTIAFDAAFEH
ncbi:sugar phosphate isomerase/epimerase family protein [Oligosphaera ethanolica]|uniref:Sugar phosphate isomerase/epimerase n=1 Tax=Oligosphaera ethanolica TaxID=760260 RepID=A0AAE3VD90_9BACT|nr:sugar phosphate isomerase/epimerase family protein [Oligosphaera ethanolica]MDQ0288188.1 sugar phosphate isomerase/epimerase [Oligosphaera ethanolica]